MEGLCNVADVFFIVIRLFFNVIKLLFHSKQLLLYSKQLLLYMNELCSKKLLLNLSSIIVLDTIK